MASDSSEPSEIVDGGDVSSGASETEIPAIADPEREAPQPYYGGSVVYEPVAQALAVEATGAPIEEERSGPPRAKIAADLAKWLLIIFGGVILLHYFVIAALVFRYDAANAVGKEQLEFVERVFNGLLPVIAGLLGSAVAYYFTREEQAV
jgi:hypothetical protein